MVIDVICSWCNKYLHTKIVGNEIDSKSHVSHSICESCKKQTMMEYKKLIKNNGLIYKKNI